jgi:hypothetical protein
MVAWMHTLRDIQIHPITILRLVHIKKTHGGGLKDIFVTKVNSSGTDLVYSTYIGWSGDDEGKDIAVDGSRNAYISGHTKSTNYDVTTCAFQTANGGVRRCFCYEVVLITTTIK